MSHLLNCASSSFFLIKWTILMSGSRASCYLHDNAMHRIVRIPIPAQHRADETDIPGAWCIMYLVCSCW